MEKNRIEITRSKGNAPWRYVWRAYHGYFYYIGFSFTESGAERAARKAYSKLEQTKSKKNVKVIDMSSGLV